MIKKIIYFVVFITTCIGSYADEVGKLNGELNATLRHGDEISVYYGVKAFKEAYKNASDGDVIILSTGAFSGETINKEITIIGANGFRANSNSNKDVTSLSLDSIKANNVMIEGLVLSNLFLQGTYDCTIRKCYISHIKSTRNHYNTLIDQCVIWNEDFFNESTNLSIKNSTLYCISKNVTEYKNNMIYVLNCWIRMGFSTLPNGIFQNCIISKDISDMPSMTAYSLSVTGNGAILRNNVFYVYVDSYYDVNNDKKVSLGSVGAEESFGNSLAYNEVIWRYGTEASGLQTESFGSGDNCCGITGGTGFTRLPSIPRIISSNISLIATDTLAVKIEVEMP